MRLLKAEKSQGDMVDFSKQSCPQRLSSPAIMHMIYVA